jgi:hypothetical protein
MHGCSLQCVITSVEQMVLHHGDVVVVTVGTSIPPEECARIHAQMMKFVPEGVRCLMVLPDLKVHVTVTEEELLETLLTLRKRNACR